MRKVKVRSGIKLETSECLAEVAEGVSDVLSGCVMVQVLIVLIAKLS
jgi:hypothetical protein